jgi:Cysteine desulfuration protein SufE
MDLQRLIDTFNFLDNWEDRYRLLIDMGRKLPEFPDESRIEANRVDGCTSNVWLETTVSDDNPPRIFLVPIVTPLSSKAWSLFYLKPIQARRRRRYSIPTSSRCLTNSASPSSSPPTAVTALCRWSKKSVIGRAPRKPLSLSLTPPRPVAFVG